MASPYQEPSWAVAPKENCCWTLLEVKGGVEIATHKLSKACTLLGRAIIESDCDDDIPLAHESCSRFHARIAFDGRGIPWLRDLASAHGTTVNRKKLPPAAVGKVESISPKAGSRGVVLHPGDVMQFGASTRMYCLEGPLEYEREAAEVKPVNLPTKQVAEAEPVSYRAPATVDNVEGVSWGMDMDDDTTYQSSEKTKSLSAQLDSSMIPEKHRKAWERLTAKKYKMQNVQQENERIRAKGELSQGQESQLQKNEERMKKWLEEIEEIERELNEKLFPDKKLEGSKKRHHHSPQVEDDDADDYVFYDRTKDSTDDLFDEGETQSSLTIKWKSLQTEWKQCSGTLKHEEQKVEQLAQQIKVSDAGDEDTFFLQNDLDLAQDSLKRTQQRHESILHNLKETERLLRIVNDTLEMDRETGFIGDFKLAPEMPPSPRQSSPRASMPPPPRTSSSPETPMPPPPRLASSPEVSTPPPPRLASSPEASSMPPPPRLPPSVSDIMLSPPVKRKRLLGPTVPPSTFAKGTEMPPPPPAKRSYAAPVGTLSVLTSSEKVPERKQRETKSSESFDPKRDVWKAPADQDGSGITKLNAKFAGRY
jgi:pSer/pThr/pTyr-binding forkhead associated (FHA) protein